MRKKISLFLLSVAWVLPVYSQLDKGLLTSNQTLVYKCAEPALYIIRQDYKLKELKTHNPGLFGRGGKPYFGRGYTLAVLYMNKLWCSSDIRSPWNSDPAFDDYRNNDTLRPVLSRVAIRPVMKKEFDYTDLTLCPDKIQDSLFQKLPVTYYELKNGTEGMPAEPNTMSRDGWLLLAFSQNEFGLNDTCNLMWSVYQPKPDFSALETEGKISDPPYKKNVLGGIYFSTPITPGVIKLMFSGVLARKLLNYEIVKIPKLEAKISLPLHDTIIDTKNSDLKKGGDPKKGDDLKKRTRKEKKAQDKENNRNKTVKKEKDTINEGE
jgi:hypothetical protein